MKRLLNTVYHNKIRIYKLILFIVICNTGFYDSMAQLENIVFDNYTTEDGLSNNMVQCAFQDSKGWMWFGTNQGLDRFDGYKFVEFKQITDDTLSIRGTLVRTIAEDNQGELWIGTSNGGINKFNRKNNTFIRYLQGKSINRLLMGKDQYLWVGATEGLYKFNTLDGTYSEYHAGNTNGDSINNDNVRALQFDIKGNLWIATDFAIDILNIKLNTFTRIKLLAPHTNNEILDIFADNDGKMWLGTGGEGLYIYDPELNKLEHFLLDIHNERSHFIRKIFKDNKGYYWLGTRGGVFIYNKAKNQFISYSNSDREPSSLIHNSILDIAPDKKGDVWICTRGGISQMISEKQLFRHYKSFVKDNRFLNNSEIYTFWREPNGNIWIGTESGGINILNPNTGTFQYITNLTSNTIKSFAEDKRGNLWVGTFLGGINVVNIASKSIIAKYLHNPDNPVSISDNRVWSLVNDASGNIWIGTDEGLDFYNASTGKIEHCKHIIKGNPVFWINKDTQNDIWIFSNRMVIIYNPLTKTQKTFSRSGWRAPQWARRSSPWRARRDRASSRRSRLRRPAPELLSRR